ncbi:hypothetical protein [Actinoplanes awajinensis]|uniref:Uncharacterized protein n=1 Tax=Actinoplanes awajinensis subsp. mycoplanecinus TaxID=135947 RepID=A0A101JL21_9ACTN|nr:hypothetical protein [Actinoplanes awajinensis]KUL28828.1 hypothetical protein ADL15_30475 [Actinoplanes awajinensis subsp. mycoplanecinus]
MTDDIQPEKSQSISERLCEILGLPAPKPFTEEQEAAYQKWLGSIDEQVAVMKARRDSRAV